MGESYNSSYRTMVHHRIWDEGTSTQDRMKVHHRKQENGTSLKTGFSYITLRYITDVKWGVNGQEGKWKPSGRGT